MNIQVSGTIEEIIAFGKMLDLANALREDAKPSSSLPRKEADFAKSGQLIEAIRCHRERTGSSLKESKTAIEASSEWINRK